jgi:hypothetical protein
MACNHAYTLPNGVGEYDLLRLSDRMSAAAQEVVPSEAAWALILKQISTGNLF